MTRSAFLIFLSVLCCQLSAQNVSAVSLDGINDRIEIGNSPLFNIEEQITLEAWVRVNEEQFENYGRIIDKFNFEEQEGYNLIINGGYLFMEIFNEDWESFGVFGNTELLDNTWHHVAGVFDGNELRIYIDGQLDEVEETGPQTINSSDTDLAFGNNWDGGSYLPLHGNIDEVRIWNVARTQEEISAFLNQCLEGNEDGLVGYWRMDEGSGITIFDLTGNDNHGSLQGGSWVTDVPDVQCCPELTIAIATVFVACNGECTGTIEILEVTGGAAPYGYLWMNGSTDDEVTGLCAGVYTVTVTDANGCTAIESIEIVQPEPLLVNVQQTGVTGFGTNDGTASAFASGGIPPYTYAWSNGGTSQLIDGLAPGDYIVTVTDANGCSTEETASVNEFPCSLTITAAVFDPNCNGSCDGSIDLMIQNAVDPVTYEWNDGSSVEDQTDVCAGDYLVTATDATGCTVIASFVLTEPDALLVTIDEVVHVTDSTSGSIHISLSGGVEPYLYAWNGPNGFTHPGQDADNLEPGVYMFVVADAHGCVASISIEILDETVGIHDLRIERLEITPNPAASSVDLNMSAEEGMSFELWTMKGEVVKTWNDTRLVDVRDIAEGVYVVRGLSQGKVAIARLVIAR